MKTSTHSNMRRITIAAAAAVAVTLASCTSLPKYEGSMSEVAAIKGHSSLGNITYWGPRTTTVMNVTGLPQDQLRRNQHGVIVPPGNYEAVAMVHWDDASLVSMIANGKKQGPSNHAVPFQAKAGHRYKVMAKNQDVKVWGLGGEKLVWVEDLETKEIAGGTPPPKRAAR